MKDHADKRYLETPPARWASWPEVLAACLIGFVTGFALGYFGIQQ